MISFQKEQTSRADKDLRVEIFRGTKDIRLRCRVSASHEVRLAESFAIDTSTDGYTAREHSKASGNRTGELDRSTTDAKRAFRAVTVTPLGDNRQIGLSAALEPNEKEASNG